MRSTGSAGVLLPPHENEPRTIDQVLDHWATLRGPGGFTFRELLDVGRREATTISMLADWLARALTVGDVEDTGQREPGAHRAHPQRRYRVTGGDRPGPVIAAPRPAR